MAHAQKSDFVYRRNGRVHLNRQGRRFSWLLAAEVWASSVLMLDTPCSGVVWRVLDAHCIRQFPLHFPSRASPCAITFQLDSTAQLYRYGRAPSLPHLPRANFSSRLYCFYVKNVHLSLSVRSKPSPPEYLFDTTDICRVDWSPRFNS